MVIKSFKIDGKQATDEKLVLTSEVAAAINHGEKSEQPVPVLGKDGEVLFIAKFLQEYNILSGLDNWQIGNIMIRKSVITLEVIRETILSPPRIRLTCEKAAEASP